MFAIHPATNTVFDLNSKVGHIQKVFAAKELYSQADNFEILFPAAATPYDKLMMWKLLDA